MTPLSPETLPRHELAGLPVSVSAADNPDLLDVEGEVVAETTRTLGIKTDGRTRQVPKEGTTFAFDLPGADDGTGSGSSDDTEPGRDDSGPVRVVVEGQRLVARPARRTETTGDNTWR